ncbi:MAG: hypothetical protein PHY62_07875 [Gallionella sp.]|nr:hypothetical protein [Gallionella sp.]
MLIFEAVQKGIYKNQKTATSGFFKRRRKGEIHSAYTSLMQLAGIAPAVAISIIAMCVFSGVQP